MIQKHAATALHYDVRFQVDDVMPSWAVPKGPSYDPKVRRLAVQTEDHPLDYQHFEGVIPKDEYGGGEVIVWDRGTYERVTHNGKKLVDMRKSIEQGHFTVMIHGEKCKGEWSFIRTGNANGKAQWIMLKHKDEYVNTTLDITKERPESVVSGKTIEDLRLPKPTKPRFIKPILDTDAEGTRVVVVKKGEDVKLYTPGRKNITDEYAAVAKRLSKHAIDDFVLDGVIIKNRFEAIDILHLLGQDTITLSMRQRTKLLDDAGL